MSARPRALKIVWGSAFWGRVAARGGHSRTRRFARVMRGFRKHHLGQQRLDREIRLLDRLIGLPVVRVLRKPVGKRTPRRIIAMAKADMPLDSARLQVVVRHDDPLY